MTSSWSLAQAAADRAETSAGELHFKEPESGSIQDTQTAGEARHASVYAWVFMRSTILSAALLLLSLPALEKGDLETWTREVQDGKIPEFGANLDY